MKKLTKDISLTLSFKLVLLVLLWWFCFKGAEKNTIDLPQWLYGINKQHGVIPSKTVSSLSDSTVVSVRH